MMIKLITRDLLSICALLLAADHVAPATLVTLCPVETPLPAAPPTETSLPAAVDPVSALNTDTKAQATFPPGFVEPLFEGENIFFTGIVPRTTIRLALSDFAGVDLTDIREVALEFDRTPSGTLFMGDIEWVR